MIAKVCKYDNKGYDHAFKGQGQPYLEGFYIQLNDCVWCVDLHDIVAACIYIPTIQCLGLIN